ncbi:MAG: coenzyme F420-0:L-glutamate ligase [Methanosarcinales archaeon]|nr:coenzyme F420-0:L-glutamate ligase [Methanosarcinales archaeon]
MEVLGIKTALIGIRDDLLSILERGMEASGIELQDGDILVVSESVIATWEGRVVALDSVVPGEKAIALAARYGKEPQEMELILRESDHIVGGIPGVVLTLKDGFLYPNAGVDRSNAPPGSIVLLPADSRKSAAMIREYFASRSGKNIAVIIGDSRTHPLRLGCVGVALACDGILPVEDARGQHDLFGRELKITRKAVADNLVSAGQIVMGEGDEGIPAVVIRDAPVEVVPGGTCQEMPTIPPQECMYIGALRAGPHPYLGGHDDLIQAAAAAMKTAYAPYSGFSVGAALLAESGQVYAAGNVENASSGADICAERAALSRALAAGETGFRALAVVADTREPIAPCGICRQNLIEFGEGIEIVMANTRGGACVATVGELLPHPFTVASMKARAEDEEKISDGVTSTPLPGK